MSSIINILNHLLLSTYFSFSLLFIRTCFGFQFGLISWSFFKVTESPPPKPLTAWLSSFLLIVLFYISNISMRLFYFNFTPVIIPIFPGFLLFSFVPGYYANEPSFWKWLFPTHLNVLSQSKCSLSKFSGTTIFLPTLKLSSIILFWQLGKQVWSLFSGGKEVSSLQVQTSLISKGI